MKDEGLFSFLSLYRACSVSFEPYLPLSVIDCIIPRVRYLCWFLISIVATPNP